MESQRIEIGKLKIFNSLLERKGMQYILDTGAEILENPVFIGDSGYHVFMCSRVDFLDPDDSFWEKIKQTGLIDSKEIADAFSRKDFITMYQQDEPVLADYPFANHRLLGARYRDGSNIFGHIGIYESHKQFDEEDLELLQILCKVMAYEMLYRYQNTYNDKKYYNVMLSLLENENVKLQEIEVCLQAAHIKLPQKMNIAVLKNITETSDLVLQRLCDFIQKQLSCQIGFVYKKRIVLLTNNFEFKKNYTILKDISDKYNLQCGISYEFENILMLKPAYKQADFALSCTKDGLLKSPAQYETCAFFHLCNLQDKAILKSICHPTLLNLIAEDKNKKTNHIEILISYLKNNGNILNASREMCMHKNSMYYRIQKIEDFLGHSLQDADFCHALYSSIKILQYLKEI